jgi:2-polyprenyl-3-methyl-5-hydroxy-6-metoxy-1,4-benzoquinol methylase
MKPSTCAIASSRPCPICTAAALFEFEAKHLKALKCSERRCGHIYAASAIPMQGVQQHYDPDEECRKYAQRNVRLVAFLGRIQFLKANSRILDVGAGAGHVAMAVRAAFPRANITCLEADPSAKAWLKKHGFNTADKLEDCTGTYDAIYMIEVIEHVDDPIVILKAVNKLLAPDGQLFITTPCGQATSGRLVHEAFDTPEHVHFFTEKSLDRALVSAGFESPKFRTLRHLYHTQRGPMVLINAAKDVARFVRAKFLGQHQLVTFVKPRLARR